MHRGGADRGDEGVRGEWSGACGGLYRADIAIGAEGLGDHRAGAGAGGDPGAGAEPECEFDRGNHPRGGEGYAGAGAGYRGGGCEGIAKVGGAGDCVGGGDVGAAPGPDGDDGLWAGGDDELHERQAERFQAGGLQGYRAGGEAVDAGGRNRAGGDGCGPEPFAGWANLGGEWGDRGDADDFDHGAGAGDSDTAGGSAGWRRRGI